MTHITYETAKRLREFCPELPEPMEGGFWMVDETGRMHELGDTRAGIWRTVHKYKLHDLLPKCFCDRFAEAKCLKEGKPIHWTDVSARLYQAYICSGGLPAVEAELMRMMEGR